MNKDLSILPNELLLTRLSLLLESLNDLYSSNSMVTESQIVNNYYDSISLFVESLNSSVLNSLYKFKSGFPADPVEYNVFTDAIQMDLSILFSEIGSLSTLVSSNFNSITSKYNQIVSNNKQISNKIGDFLLYSDPSLGAGFFFGDSFETTNNLDIGSPLVDGEECFHSLEEGRIFLPLDGEPTRLSFDSIVINSNSNGHLGSNYQLDVTGHNQIETIGDGQADTWIEYEKVGTLESSSLVLDITIKLKEISILNYININPINFGTATPVKINFIETSRDGKEFLSIKDELPIKDFLSEDVDNVFNLGASTSSFSGQGCYSFLARKAQYIHIQFEQTTPYVIDTNSGERLRYAIGIKDINIYSRKFKSSGSIVSKEFSATEEIKKVSLLASENPLEASVLADIEHYISHNNGGIWTQIQPQNRDNTTIEEVVNYNNSDKDSINTESTVSALLHKIYMSRDKEAFEGNVIIKEKKLNGLDIINSSPNSEREIFLTKKPIENTVSLVVPFLGSFSCPRDRGGSAVAGESTPIELDTLDFSIDVSDSSTIKYKLPFTSIDNLEEKIRVFVNGSQIEYLPKLQAAFSSPTPTSYETIDENSKVYFLNQGGKELQFGYTDINGTQRGFIPTAGSKIQVCLDGDNPSLEFIDNKYILNLSMPSDGIKDKCMLYQLSSLDDSDFVQVEVNVPANQKIFKIKDLNTLESLITYKSGRDYFELKEYTLNGSLITSNKQYTDKVEFTSGLLDVTGWEGLSTNKYTFDSSAGILYLSVPVPSDRKVVLSCYKANLEKIESDSFSFYYDSSHKIDTSKIEIDPKSIKSKVKIYSFDNSEEVTNINLTPNNTIGYSWTNEKIVKGTVSPSKSLLNGISLTEIEYIDGATEFFDVNKVEEESIVFTESSIETNIWEYNISELSDSHILIGSPSFGVYRDTSTLSSPVCQFDISGQVASASLVPAGTNGTWAIEDNVLYLKLSTTPNNHYISYSFKNFDRGLNPDELYSVDYNNGVIYFPNALTNEGTIRYEVSSYSSFYNIAKKIDESFVENIDIENKKVKFTASYVMDLLKQDLINRSRPQVFVAHYRYNNVVSDSIADLEPYFSPICDNVSFRMVTKNLLEEL